MRYTLPLIVLALTAGCGPRPAPPLERSLADLAVIGTKELIHSEVLNEDRPYWVYVPPSSPKSGRKLSVLFLLDGDAHFHSVSGLAQILGTGINGVRRMPETIVVAIPNTDRIRDLTPTNTSTPGMGNNDFWANSGGGDRFLDFLQNELIPRIDSTYPTSGYRMLLGHSLGGLMAIHALHSRPQLFHSVIAIDPSLWYDNQFAIRQVPAAFQHNDYTYRSLYIAKANSLKPGEVSNSHVQSIDEYRQTLMQHENRKLHWSFRYYPDDDHSSVTHAAAYDGLRFIFRDFFPTYEEVGADPSWVSQVQERFLQPPPEGLLEEFARRSLIEGHRDRTRSYLTLHVSCYPQSGRAHRNLGHYWAEQGDTIQAVTCYKKALDLDPSDTTTRQALRRMSERN